MPFGQVVLGPPGSGKSTYCYGMQQFLAVVERDMVVVNLDPGNEVFPYKCHVNVMDLVSVENVMNEFHLGPNGALLYAMEYLEKNLDWLYHKLRPFEGHYLVFDCPGQVELYTHHMSMRRILAQMQQEWNFRLTAVHLVDSFYCGDVFTFVAATLLSLSTMLQLELPHVNVLSKIDLIQQYGSLHFPLEFYADVVDLTHIVNYAHSASSRPNEMYKNLTERLCEVIDDFSLVSFHPLHIEDKESVLRLLKIIDKANGYIYGGASAQNKSMLDVVAKDDTDWDFERFASYQERYVDGK